jgi:hypothetical protein
VSRIIPTKQCAKSLRITSILLALAVSLAAGGVYAADSDLPEGFRTTPNIGYKSGDHSLDLSLVSRGRWEIWDAHARKTDDFYALRTRVGLKYSFGDLLTGYGEFQDARIWSLGTNASGAGSLYQTHSTRNGSGSRTNGQDLRQLWLEIRPMEDLAIKGGRHDIKGGTEVMYPEANWKYLKIKRASQRLVGTVGWTHAERTNDGFSGSYDLGDHRISAFAARPTTGVFDVDGAYRHQDDITYGGISWTAKRGAWLPNTEVRLFGLGYEDDRPIKDGGRADDVEVWTLGFSTIGVYPLGPGRADLLVWGAYQFGDFTPPGPAGTKDLSHSAAAGILEVGYQLHEAPWTPWFRLGVNVASGDGSKNDSDHNTFFNMLPTNHLYYGFADQLAFSNLVDWFAQVMVKPCPKLSVNMMLHQFSLQNDKDDQYFGTGAFNKEVFGFGQRPSRGYSGVATELDTVVNYTVNKHLSLQAGYAYMWGRGVWNTFSDEDVRFGYLQVTLKY